MGLINLTKKELILKIEELNKLISDKKEITEGSSDVSKNKNAIYYLLKESESKLKEAQAIAHIGHWNLDIINNKIEWSDEIYRIFGMDPNKFEATYENFLKAIHPDDRELVNKSYTESLKNKTRYDITHRIVLPDGEIRFVREQCKTNFDKYDDPISSLGTIQDITELKFAEEELLRSEKRFKRLFEELGDAVYVTKIGGENKGQILEANKAAVKQSGYTRNELLKLNIISDIFISGSGEYTTAEWEEKLNSGKSVTTVEKKKRKDGSEFWTEVRVTSIDFKGERASLSINHDITERKEAEDKLKKSEEKYHGMIQNLMEGFYSVNMDGILLDYNPEFKRIVGLDPNKDYKGIKLQDFWQNPEERVQYIEDFVKNGFVKNFIVNAKKTDGKKMICQVNSLLVRDKEGNPLRMEGTFLEITDRIKSEEKIRKLNDELEDKVKKRTMELSQEKYFSDVVINSLPGIFSLIGEDGSHVRWNQNHEKVTGFSTKEYKQMQALDFFDKSEKGKILNTISQIFEKGKGNVELNLLTKKGKSIPYFFTGRRIDINNKKYIAGMAIDITKRKNTEKELRKKTEDLEAFNNVMIEREIRIIEMKEEVNRLSEQIGIEPPYPPVWKNIEPANENNKNQA